MSKNEIAFGPKLIIGYLGAAMLMVGIICLLPLLLLFFYPEELENAKYFAIPGVLAIFLGYLLYLPIQGKEKRRLEKHQDSLLVVLIWVITIFICSIPFLLTGKYNFTQSMFEATSGFSTTGLSVVNVEEAPRIFLLFRSLTLFFGGVGLVLVMTSVLSDRYGMRIYNAEGHTDKLLPNLVKSARIILLIYSGYIVLGVILYVIFGMPLFDAINHSISALSTGGFSTRALNIGYFDNLGIEMVSIFLMLLGSTNFFIHLLLLKRQFKKVFQHCETQLLLALLVILVPLLALILANASNMSFWEALRVSTFQFATAITTTGFQTVKDFRDLPFIFNGILIILMLIGGGIGSTAGGIKQYRVSILLKDVFWNFKKRLSSKNVVRTNFLNKAGESVIVTEEDLQENYSFIALYLFIFLIGSFIFAAFGNSMENSMFEFASALGTVGISVGITGYYAHPVILWTGIMGMFLGRLEIYIVMLTILRAIAKWTKRVTP